MPENSQYPFFPNKIWKISWKSIWKTIFPSGHKISWKLKWVCVYLQNSLFFALIHKFFAISASVNNVSDSFCPKIDLIFVYFCGICKYTQKTAKNVKKLNVSIKNWSLRKKAILYNGNNDCGRRNTWIFHFCSAFNWNGSNCSENFARINRNLWFLNKSLLQKTVEIFYKRFLRLHKF